MAQVRPSTEADPSLKGTPEEFKAALGGFPTNVVVMKLGETRKFQDRVVNYGPLGGVSFPRRRFFPGAGNRHLK